MLWLPWLQYQLKGSNEYHGYKQHALALRAGYHSNQGIGYHGYNAFVFGRLPWLPTTFRLPW